MKKILNMKICTQGSNTDNGLKKESIVKCITNLYLAFIIRNLFF